LQTRWAKESTSPFPTVPADTTTWINTVSEAPRSLLRMLQSFESPEYILSTMTDAVLDTWTEQSRLECLLHCLESWAAVPDQDVGRKEWLLERCADLWETAAGSPEKLDIYAPVMWNTLKAANFGNSRLLELCQTNETQVLSRMIVAAFIYEVKLRAL
ncbi:hypothetical protein PHYSODRAFT_456561, partial [Phytophthora sojae]